MQLFQRCAPRRKLPEDLVIEDDVGEFEDLEVARDERRVLQPPEVATMSGKMYSTGVALDSSFDPCVCIQGFGYRSVNR
jgi:hypothetical protein